MSTTYPPETNIPPELLAALEEAIQDAIKGIYRPEKMEEAARDLEEGREEIRRRLGETHLAEYLTSHGDDDE